MQFALSFRCASLCLALGGVGVVAPESLIFAQADQRERTLFVSAVDSSGEPVAGLSANDFVIREDGLRREVLRVSRAIEPIDIAVLVDNSAAAEDAITSIRDGLGDFVAKMAPQNQIALVTLADRPTIVVDYTSDAKRLGDGVSRVFSMSRSGMTFLDAVVEVSRGLERRESSRAVIVPVITDGIEFSNRYYQDVLDSLVRADTALHAVTVGTFPITGDQVTRERAYFLDHGPRDSGGQRIALLTPTAIPFALDRLARELSSQYKVVYSRPESLIPPETLDVTSSKAGVTVRAAPLRRQVGA